MDVNLIGGGTLPAGDYGNNMKFITILDRFGQLLGKGTYPVDKDINRITQVTP